MTRRLKPAVDVARLRLVAGIQTEELFRIFRLLRFPSVIAPERS